MSSRTQSEKDSERTTSFETAARTRPLSIQDILLQREKKVAAEAKKTKEELQELQDNGKGKPNHLESGRGYKSRKDLKDIPMEGSKKENVRDKPRKDSKKDDVRHTLKEGTKNENTRYIPREVSKKENLKNRPKDGSRMDDLKDTPKVPRKDDQRDAPMKGSKKQRSSIGDDSKSAGKDKSTHGLHKLGTSMSGRADESKDGNHGEIRERTGDATISESLKGPGKRWSGETVDNDRIKERSEKLWNETKRKVRSFDDEKSSEVERLVLKKHGSARFQDSKYSDRNDGRKEYGKPYHEEPRSKRRRSRSRGHDLEGRDRSVSLSPREQRHSYRGHDHDKYPPYYSVDKSRRKYAETDRHRTSGNGGHSGMSYRRYESRLGGYSPRKRKTAPQDEQATTKTAPPVVRSPEKKSATWDQPPAGADQSNFFTTLQPIVSQVTSSVSVSFTAPKHPATTPETVLAGNSSSIDSVQLTQATRPLRRLHIENLPSSVSEDMLIGCLNDFLLSSGANNIQRSKQPCLSCTINKEKRQAFVEFLTPEDATAALSFDGRSFNGSALKIRRPKEYIEMANVAPKKPAEEIKLTSDVVADSPHKIFVAGISGVISPEMLVEIVSSFGQLAAYRFLCNGDLGGRCAFLEYIDHSITYKACAGLNGMKLGGCILTAVQVFPNHLEVRNEASPFYGIPDSARALLEVPTKVLQLKNVFDREEYLLLSKSELEELLEDVRMECARFGAVKSINIVEYPASSDSTTDDIIVKPDDGPVKLEPTEHRANDNCTDTGIECSLPNKSIDVPGHSDPTETKDVVPVSEGQDHKELDKLCECDAPAAADQYTDLGYIHARAAGPTLDQHTEADHMDSMQADHVDSMQADHNATAVGDDSAVGKGHQEPRTLEICSSTTPGDVGERSERENEQQDANDVSESDAEKVPAADTRDDALVSGTNVLEAGSILVEFMRKEAACMAAHCLHGRCFGNRTVSAGYAPHDLYLRRYPR